MDLKKISLNVILILIWITACNNVNNSKVPQRDIIVKIPAFNKDSAFNYIERQLSFGPRTMNSIAHKECKNWIVNTMLSFNFDVIEQDFQEDVQQQGKVDATNIIARYNPDVLERVLLCAHYDTRGIAENDSIRKDEPIPGADDGASGVAVLLELARNISQCSVPIGVDIIFFDAEDQGLNQIDQDYSWGLGAQYWSKNLHETPYNVKFGVLFDMVGAKDATFRKEGYSIRYAGDITNRIWNLAKAMHLEKYFINENTIAVTDDHRFITENANIPMVDIINVKSNGRFGHHHHTHNDNIEIIDKATLRAVGQVMLAVIIYESNKQHY